MHLSSDAALDLIEGRADETETEFWQDHFENCINCRELFAEWNLLHKHMKRANLVSAPEAAIRHAERITAVRETESRPKIRQLLASLVFDSLTQPAFAGARGSTSDSRQMLLRADEFDIHIKIWGGPQSRRIAGQLMARNDNTFLQEYLLHLLSDGEGVETTLANRFGEFEFFEVPEGSLSLQLELPDTTLAVTLQ